jgi:hypothetical protein
VATFHTLTELSVNEILLTHFPQRLKKLSIVSESDQVWVSAKGLRCCLRNIIGLQYLEELGIDMDMLDALRDGER